MRFVWDSHYVKTHWYNIRHVTKKHEVMKSLTLNWLWSCGARFFRVTQNSWSFIHANCLTSSLHRNPRCEERWGEGMHQPPESKTIRRMFEDGEPWATWASWVCVKEHVTPIELGKKRSKIMHVPAFPCSLDSCANRDHPMMATLPRFSQWGSPYF